MPRRRPPVVSFVAALQLALVAAACRVTTAADGGGGDAGGGEDTGDASLTAQATASTVSGAGAELPNYPNWGDPYLMISMLSCIGFTLCLVLGWIWLKMMRRGNVEAHLLSQKEMMRSDYGQEKQVLLLKELRREVHLLPTDGPTSHVNVDVGAATAIAAVNGFSTSGVPRESWPAPASVGSHTLPPRRGLAPARA